MSKITKAIKYHDGNVKVISDDGTVKTEAIRVFADVKDEIAKNIDDNTILLQEIDERQFVNISKEVWLK